MEISKKPSAVVNYGSGNRQQLTTEASSS